MNADGLDEAAHRAYMSAATAAGEQAKALITFAALRERLQAELGSDPAPQTRSCTSRSCARRRSSQPGMARCRGSRRRRHQASAARPARSRPELTGRRAELAALRTAWSRAAVRAPGLVLIAGEAGIGKTTLAEFMATEAANDGATVLRSRCYETERSLFLQPIVEALHSGGCADDRCSAPGDAGPARGRGSGPDADSRRLARAASARPGQRGDRAPGTRSRR